MTGAQCVSGTELKELLGEGELKEPFRQCHITASPTDRIQFGSFEMFDFF